jgi:hypothetical protein
LILRGLGFAGIASAAANLREYMTICVAEAYPACFELDTVSYQSVFTRA